MIVLLVLGLAISGVLAFLCAKMAAKRGRNALAWGWGTFAVEFLFTFIFGMANFVIGIFAIILLAILGHADDSATTARNSGGATGSTAQDLAHWKKLLDDGAITRDEFEQQKRRLLGS